MSQDARETLESGEVNDNLGRILLQQFDALPDLRVFTQNDEPRKTDIADLNVRRLEHRAEARRIADKDAAVERLMLELQTDASARSETETEADVETVAQKAKLWELVQQRQAQLDKALASSSRAVPPSGWP